MSITRQFVFAVDPTVGYTGMVGLAATYSYPFAPDGNSDTKSITCAYAPRSKGNKIGPMQDALFMGTLSVGKMYQTFREDLAQDDGTTVSAEAISARIDPTLATDEDSDQKRYLSMELPDVNPIALGLTLQFAKNVHDPQKVSPTWLNFVNTNNRTKIGIPSGLAKWIHLRIVDATARTSRLVFGGFKLNYYDLLSREETT